MKNKLHVIHKKPIKSKSFRAGDNTILREVLHPKNDEITLPYSLAAASIGAHERSLPHRLAQSETYHFITGHGHIMIDGEKFVVEAGHTVLVPAQAEQYVVNESEQVMEFLCIVSPPWTEAGEEIL